MGNQMGSETSTVVENSQGKKSNLRVYTRWWDERNVPYSYLQVPQVFASELIEPIPLPDALLLKIFSYLSMKDLCAVSGVCGQWNRIARICFKKQCVAAYRYITTPLLSMENPPVLWDHVFARRKLLETRVLPRIYGWLGVSSSKGEFQKDMVRICVCEVHNGYLRELRPSEIKARKLDIQLRQSFENQEESHARLPSWFPSQESMKETSGKGWFATLLKSSEKRVKLQLSFMSVSHVQREGYGAKSFALISANSLQTNPYRFHSISESQANLWMESIQMQAGFQWLHNPVQPRTSMQDAKDKSYFDFGSAHSDFLFLLKGAHGCGKSTLLSTILQKPLQTRFGAKTLHSCSFVLGRVEEIYGKDQNRAVPSSASDKRPTFDDEALLATSVDFCIETLESVIVNRKRETIRAVHPMPKSWYSRLSAVIFMFDVSNRSSFRMVMQEVKKFSTDIFTSTIPFVIIGNKTDTPLKERKISFEEVRTIIPLNIPYYEISALYAGNVEHVFLMMLRQLSLRNKLSSAAATFWNE